MHELNIVLATAPRMGRLGGLSPLLLDDERLVWRGGGQLHQMTLREEHAGSAGGQAGPAAAARVGVGRVVSVADRIRQR
jgi:hypothetical protein